MLKVQLMFCLSTCQTEMNEFPLVHFRMWPIPENDCTCRFYLISLQSMAALSPPFISLCSSQPGMFCTMQDHASYVYVQLQFGYIVFCNQQLNFRYLLYSILALTET